MKLCPICRKLYKPGPYAQHMKRHVRRGEVTRREVVTSDAIVDKRPWQRTFVYEVKK